MKQQYIITIDVGTSSTKTALWDENGQVVATASASYPLQRPRPLWAEIDGDVWWEAVCQTVRQMMTAGGIQPSAVAGIGVDGVGWTLLPVDEVSNPLSPAMIWLDRRAEAETAWLNGRPDANQMVNLSANLIDAAYITPKLLWFKHHHPELFAAAHKFIGATGFIVARLTEAFTCDYTQAYGYHFFDIRNERWDTALAEDLGIPLEKMPELYASTAVVGTVTQQAAEQTGLVADTPVIAGCLDAAAGALGAGVTRQGQTNEQGGQAGGMAVSLDRVVVEPRLIFSHHVLPGQYLLQAGTVGGGSLGWFRDQFGQLESDAAAITGQSPFELFSLQADQSPPGAHGLLFLPYMAGERTPLWSSVARGVFFGLSYNTTRADMLRAIMEGCAFAVYDNLQIAEAHGVRVDEYLGSGGATQSGVWCQIKADVYGRPFIVARRGDGGEGGHSLGLFALTAFGVGLVDDIGRCVEELLPERQVFAPNMENHTMYQELFSVYRQVSRKLMDDFAHLDAVAKKFF